MLTGRQLNPYQIVLIVGMLVSGSINTVSKSAQNHSHQKGLYCLPECSNGTYNTRTSCTDHGADWDCSSRPFDAPWLQTLVMFIGESLALIGFFYNRRKAAAKRDEEQRPLLSGNPPSQDKNEGVEKPPGIFQPILIVPTLCDLTGTTLAGIGLLYVYASVWQMLRGSIIIFTGLFSVIFLKRKLRAYHWVGMGITSIGLLLVGLASVLAVKDEQGAANSHSKGQTTLGILLVLSAQVISATQMVIEETYLKKRKLPPLQVVGSEGLFGAFLMVVLPIVYVIPGPQPSHFKHGSYENSLDAAAMISHNSVLLIMIILYCLSITFYNFFGLSVTKSLSAVHRTLIDACRTLLVWVIELFLHYGLKQKNFGEEWTKYSYMQLGGFVFLLVGTMMYNRVIRVKALGSDFDESTGSPATNDTPKEVALQAPDHD